MNAQPARRSPSREPTNEDVARYVPLVHEVVRRLLRRFPSSVRREELIAAGMVGLWDSIRRSDLAEGPRFEWYARIRIRGAILDELRAQDWLPRRARWVAAGRRAPKAGQTCLPTAVVGFDDLGAAEQARHLVDSSTIDSGAQIELRSDQRSVVQAIDQLPEREGIIVRLHYFEDVRFSEIGVLLGVSEPRISQLHSRAIGRLRALIRAGEAAA